MINWWLEKGLSGFRIDAIINIKKDPAFPDFAPDGTDGLAKLYQNGRKCGRRRRTSGRFKEKYI